MTTGPVRLPSSQSKESSEVKVESVLGHVNAQGQLVTFSNGIRAPYDVGMAHDYMMAPSCGQWSRGSVMSQ